MKTIIITGANGNLGSVVTDHFLQQGYRVLATVIRESMLQAIHPHANLELAVVNLLDEVASAQFISSAIERYQRIDAVLLLAGGFTAGNIATTSINDIKGQCQLNFETAYNIARPAFAHMKTNGNGRLIFIGSKAGLNATEGKELTAYGLSKSLLFKLADYLNEEAKGTNIVSTVVVPGTIDTAANRQAMPGVDPSNWVKPADLAGMFEFICSEKGIALRETVIKMYNNS